MEEEQYVKRIVSGILSMCSIDGDIIHIGGYVEEQKNTEVLRIYQLLRKLY